MTRPSKQFIIRGSVAIGIVALVLIVQTDWFRALFRKAPLPPVDTTTVGDVLEQDSNGNSIPDWEEQLWGLDPTVLYTNGVPNRQIIEEKKRSLGVAPVDISTLNETDKLSRELFTLATALGQSQEVDNATLSEIAARFGSTIDTDLVRNTYSAKDVKTIKTTSQSLIAYTAELQKVMTKYDKGQADIDVIAGAVETGDEAGLAELDATRASYRSFAKELIALNVPIGIAPYHLTIANSVAGIADSLLSALVGIAVYKQYSLSLDAAVAEMGNYLREYGILSS